MYNYGVYVCVGVFRKGKTHEQEDIFYAGNKRFGKTIVYK